MRRLDCFYLNTMSGGDGRRFFHHLLLHYALHYKRPVQALLESIIGVRMPFKWRKRRLSERRASLYPQLSVASVCGAFASAQQQLPDVLGLSEVLRSQHKEYIERLIQMGYASVHVGLGHKAKGVKDHLSVLLATREPSEPIPLPHPFKWGKRIGGGGGATMARGQHSGVIYFCLHLCTTEKVGLYRRTLKTINDNLLALPPEQPVVVMGDFNQDIPYLRKQIPALAQFDDAVGRPDEPTFLLWWDRKSVDHIFTRGLSLNTQASRIIHDGHRSDHAAVRAIVGANGALSTGDDAPATALEPLLAEASHG
ncbi:endonuclease/exonuclease/phosphatase family protein [Magnetofaba australis]|uniref:Putative endonuclease/exonuclease/phosphatase n=1 Tax=Magnetofaba australis IT-1 TaxID=1434232 RepID=A0A1Y2K392_9PROT|nr:endonuclease/exonuclease/phosphatase family protein [Magnetofaba australis]OSM02137.1 putative endonuclease/exonuclease/phosphatase [Magnetofaba australis IT-1]